MAIGRHSRPEMARPVVAVKVPSVSRLYRDNARGTFAMTIGVLGGVLAQATGVMPAWAAFCAASAVGVLVAAGPPMLHGR